MARFEISISQNFDLGDCLQLVHQGSFHFSRIILKPGQLHDSVTVKPQIFVIDKTHLHHYDGCGKDKHDTDRKLQSDSHPPQHRLPRILPFRRRQHGQTA